MIRCDKPGCCNYQKPGAASCIFCEGFGCCNYQKPGANSASTVRGPGAATTRNQGQTQHLLRGVRVLQLPETRGNISIYCEESGCCNYQKLGANSASTVRGSAAATTRNQGQTQHLRELMSPSVVYM